MSRLYPDLSTPGDNIIRDEGIAAHWVAHKIGQEDFVFEGEIAPNGVEITDEILDGAILFVDTIRARGLPLNQ